MNILGLLSVILFLAVLVETLTEYIFGQAFDHLPALLPWRWTLIYSAAVVGVVGAVLLRFDLLYLLAQTLGVEWPELANPTILGMVLTGLAIGRGSNYLHDLVVTYFGNRPAAGAG